MQHVNYENLKKVIIALRALAHPLRLKIMGFIDKHQTINVNKIYGTLKLEQSITSQHLRILRNAGLVKAQRKGKFIFYTVNHSRIDQIMKLVNDFLAK